MSSLKEKNGVWVPRTTTQQPPTRQTRHPKNPKPNSIPKQNPNNSPPKPHHNNPAPSNRHQIPNPSSNHLKSKNPQKPSRSKHYQNPNASANHNYPRNPSPSSNQPNSSNSQNPNPWFDQLDPNSSKNPNPWFNQLDSNSSQNPNPWFDQLDSNSSKNPNPWFDHLDSNSSENPDTTNHHQNPNPWPNQLDSGNAQNPNPFLSNEPTMFTVTFAGQSVETTITSESSIADEWVQKVIGKRKNDNGFLVGLDIEWKPNYGRGQDNEAALLQICVERECLVLQLLYLDSLPRGVMKFLSHANNCFVGVGIANDLEKLEDDYGMKCRNHLELRKVASEKMQKKDVLNCGLKDLVKQVLGVELNKSKRITMSDWSRTCLTGSQIEYACLDAYVCGEMGRVLVGGYQYE
ncbi:Werner Syndrome-like exonuclease [Amborella trichopoda]|uniref:3'-5' exonuclease domain-containing protein n=1 Tax=Amborella trichopoda TaxID=13333 RepID=W1P6U2_AMBTC|nr:Werner Syndrome-like exonuclease [Amborella trichopoda]ERN03306.1 hypothetical protein AMTR_s00003p00231040 [Amborella trichopoda]|eukprot:XP_006841631.1 Werner Syndrome-like exonuclease [Amborella trichopoda]